MSDTFAASHADPPADITPANLASIVEALCKRAEEAARTPWHNGEAHTQIKVGAYPTANACAEAWLDKFRELFGDTGNAVLYWRMKPEIKQLMKNRVGRSRLMPGWYGYGRCTIVREAAVQLVEVDEMRASDDGMPTPEA